MERKTAEERNMKEYYLIDIKLINPFYSHINHKDKDVEILKKKKQKQTTTEILDADKQSMATINIE